MSAREVAADDVAQTDDTPAPPPTLRVRAAALIRRANPPVDYGPPTRPLREFRNRRTLLDLVLLLLLVTIGLVSFLQLGHLRVPYVYNGDALSYGANIRNLVEGRWVQHTPRLGAPFGQDMYDMPIGGDNGNYLLLKLMTVGSKDWGLLLNLFYLAGFYLSAVSAWFCARLLGCSRLTAIGVALLFDFAQYHFWRYGHTMLANYFVVPIAVVLAVRAAHGYSYDLRGRLRSRLLPSLGTLLACIAVGSFGAYYAVFAAITVAFMGGAAAVSGRSLRPLLHGAMVSATVMVVLVVNEAQSLLYQSRNGVDQLVAQRQSIEQDRYGLRLIQLLSPTPGGHFDHGPLRRATQLFVDSGYPTEASEALGLVAAITFALMLVWIVIRLFGSGGGAAGTPATKPPGVTLQLLALTSTFWVLLATAGGLDWFIWLVGFHEIRSWGRASILILFMTLVWGARLLSQWRSRRETDWSRRRRVGVSAAIAVVVLLGVLEETPRSRFPNGYGQTVANYQSDKDFFTQLDRQLPAETMVFNLPIRRYPEEPPTVRSVDYELLIPFLDTSTLRFSYGGMKGRQSEWQQWLLRAQPQPAELVQAVAAVGFRAVLVDTYGYADNGVSLIRSLQALLGEAPLSSRDHRWVAFPLADWIAAHPPSTALRDQLLTTPLVVAGACGLPNACPSRGGLMVTTPTPTTDRPLTISVTSTRGPGTFTVGSTTYRIGPQPTLIQLSAGSQTYTNFSYDSSTPTPSGAASGLQINQVLPSLIPVG